MTKRMIRIIHHAEHAMKITNCNVLQPIHLLIGCLAERSGVLGEIYLHCQLDVSILRAAASECEQPPYIGNQSFFSFPYSSEVHEIFDGSLRYMNHYKQIYLNEGHLLKALIMTGAVDDYLTENQRQLILTLGTTARDLITNLQKQHFPTDYSTFLSKAGQENATEVRGFVEQYFSSEWAQTIEQAFQSEVPPIFIARNEENTLVGFAAYDCYQNKKGYFGPMGVWNNDRSKGIGQALLNHCLQDMKDIGYAYAVIGGAGPIEFYEKTCRAVLIPFIK